MSPSDQRSVDFIEILAQLNIDYALIGGMAFGMWTEPRFTQDIDLTIALNPKSWEALNSFLASSPDATINLVAHDKEAHDILPHLVRIKYKDEAIDLITSLTEYQAMLLSRKEEKDYFGKKIFIASPEDIIISKLIAKRKQDILDIEKLIQNLSNLDLAYIQKWAKEWEVLDLWNEIYQKASITV